MKGRIYLVNRLVVFMFMLALVPAVPVAGRTIYVDPNGSVGFIGIQAAIDNANDYDEIKIAPGIYNEAINFNGKAVRLYSSGGSEVTIIDGTGHCHVVQCVSGEDANTILEGFTITGGKADDNSPHDSGGGMYNGYGSPTVINCTFSGNLAIQGGGMYNNGNPTVTNCTFSNNSATDDGGGMFNYGSSPTLTNCTFRGNSATQRGGGMFNWESNPTVINCTFTLNSTDYGGGVYNLGQSPTITNCTFSNNTADYGGGMYNTGSSPTLTNCTFCNNTADYGGGMCNWDFVNAKVINCTFSGNASGEGGGMLNYQSKPTVTNCILWGDIPDEISNNTSTVTVTYSDVDGGYAGMGNIDTDPYFVDAKNPDPNLWDLRLKPQSPCIDAGDTTTFTPGIFIDADGNLRGVDVPAKLDTGISFSGVTVDIGAYEFQLCRIASDINCDGIVNFKDLSMICADWLVGIEPEL